MKKLSLLALMAMVSGVVFAQDAPKQSRNLSIYMDISSGQLAPGAWTDNGGKNGIEHSWDTRGRAFQGNEEEWGIRYSQNFKAAPWLSMGGTLAFVMNFNGAYDANDKFVGMNVSGGQGASVGNIKSNVWISMPYFMLLMDARGLMGVYTSYSKSFGKGGSFGIGADLEYFFSGTPWYNVPKVVNGVTPVYIVDYFGLWLNYSVGLGKGFSFSTALQFRLNANVWNGFAGVEQDPAGSFELRWNTTFAYGIDGWGMFLQFRLSGFGLAKSSQALYANKDAAAVFQIISGISYNFDLSK